MGKKENEEPEQSPAEESPYPPKNETDEPAEDGHSEVPPG